MRKKHLLFLAALLSQMGPTYGVRFDLVGDPILEPGRIPRGRFNVISTDGAVHITEIPFSACEILFEKRLKAHDIPNLVPYEPVAIGVCGDAVKCVKAKFHYEGGDEQSQTFELQTRYPLQVEWKPDETVTPGEKHPQILTYFQDENNRRIDMGLLPTVFSVQEDCLSTDPEQCEGFRYDGSRVFEIWTQRQIWQLAGHPPRTLTAKKFKPNLRMHNNRTTVFAQPFLDTEDAVPASGFEGNYTSLRTLTTNELYPHISERSLVYFDGTHLYKPFIKQELWARDDQEVRFLTVSYNPCDRLDFIPGALVHNALPDTSGLYQLVMVEENQATPPPRPRIERWEKVETFVRPGSSPGIPQTAFCVETPAGIPAIPGMETSLSNTRPSSIVQRSKSFSQIKQKIRDVFARRHFIIIWQHGLSLWGLLA